ncbi:MAG: aminoglycoside phosphotransferase family protein [Candidatus Nanopelagicales bacterium]
MADKVDRGRSRDNFDVHETPALPPSARHGAQNLVLLDPDNAVVRRYPRTPAGIARLPAVAERWRAVNALGLPAPRLLSVHPDAGDGEAYLTLSLLPGAQLAPLDLSDPAAPPPIPPGLASTRLGADLARVLVQMREVTDAAWPAPSGWIDLWDDMAARTRVAVLPLLAPADANRAREDLRTAGQAARARPNGLCHGDLGPHNLHVDPDSGALLGIIDWDDVMRGDVAGDVAALRAGLPPAVTAAMLAAAPSLTHELARFVRYVATWPLQEALFGVEHERPDLVADGVARFRAGG